jgi:hypothetical protein
MHHSSVSEYLSSHTMSEASPFSFKLPESAQLLIQLENRQDDVLRELDELNSQIERAIVSGQMHVCSASKSPPLVLPSGVTHAGLSVPTC